MKSIALCAKLFMPEQAQINPAANFGELPHAIVGWSTLTAQYKKGGAVQTPSGQMTQGQLMVEQRINPIVMDVNMRPWIVPNEYCRYEWSILEVIDPEEEDEIDGI